MQIGGYGGAAGAAREENEENAAPQAPPGARTRATPQRYVLLCYVLPCSVVYCSVSPVPRRRRCPPQAMSAPLQNTCDMRSFRQRPRMSARPGAIARLHLSYSPPPTPPHSNNALNSPELPMNPESQTNAFSETWALSSSFCGAPPHMHKTWYGARVKSRKENDGLRPGGEPGRVRLHVLGRVRDASGTRPQPFLPPVVDLMYCCRGPEGRATSCGRRHRGRVRAAQKETATAEKVLAPGSGAQVWRLNVHYSPFFNGDGGFFAGSAERGRCWEGAEVAAEGGIVLA
eukprot:gene25602-biopygen10524